MVRRIGNAVVLAYNGMNGVEAGELASKLSGAASEMLANMFGIDFRIGSLSDAYGFVEVTSNSLYGLERPKRGAVYVAYRVLPDREMVVEVVRPKSGCKLSPLVTVEKVDATVQIYAFRYWEQKCRRVLSREMYLDLFRTKNVKNMALITWGSRKRIWWSCGALVSIPGGERLIHMRIAARIALRGFQ